MNDLILFSEENPSRDLIDRRPNFLEKYEAAKVRYEYISNQLHKITARQALEKWLSTLSPNTAISYGFAFKRLEELQFVIIDCNLRQFSMFNHEIVIDTIKNHAPWSEATRQARAAAYVSFTGFLERQTGGVIQKAITKKRGVNRTFFKIREKVKTKALSIRQTKIFLREMDKLGERYGLLAKVMLQGGKRTNEVLNLPIKNIDFLKNQITFIQSKTSGKKKTTVINYPSYIMRQLRRHIGKRTGEELVFVNNNGNKVCLRYLHNIFAKAGKKARIPFNVSPHVLRVTLVTRLKELRVQNTDIMKITGHSSVQQLDEYDKSDAGENATLHYTFI